MSDDLNDLKKLMVAATPRPDPDARAKNIALAQKNFADLQGSRDALRPTSDRPETGFISGVKNMLNTLTSRAGLTASTALIAVGLVAFTPVGDGLLNPDALGVDPVQKPAPAKGTPSTPSEVVRPKPADVAARQDAETRTTPELVDTTDDALLSEIPQAAPSPSIAAPSIELAETEEADFAGGATPTAPAVAQKRARASLQSMEAVTGGIVASEAPQAADASRVQSPGTFDLNLESIVRPEPNTETFANEAPNPVKVTSETPVSTFSIDVDTASYAVVRNSLSGGRLPNPNAVRIEEMVNYFSYDYPAPADGVAFQPSVSVTQTPWNSGTQLVQIGLQGAVPELADRPPLNLVFLIDTSGSMNNPAKLPLLKQSFRLMLAQLRPEDQVAIVTYAGSAGLALEPTAAGERSKILTAIDRLGAGGSTAGQWGLQLAYATASAMAEDGDVNRVILATDGDFNVGLSDPEALKGFIADKRDTGTYLSVLGFGRGNLDDATMQALAQNGNGTAAYIDTLSEAQKVLVDQLTGALFPIANDVKIQVEFNPATVSEYRLIGYETRALRREDFNNDKVDAGDIGAGHQVTALYEVTPVGSPAQLNEPLRYAQTDAATGDSDELAFLRLRYKTPGATESQLIETPIRATDASDAGFAAAMAGFGQLLQNGSYLGDWSYGDAIALATAAKGADPFGYRAEAIQLMRLADSLSR